MASVGSLLGAHGVRALNLDSCKQHVDLARSFARFGGSVEGRQRSYTVQAKLEVGETGDGRGIGIVEGGSCFLRQ